MKPKSLAIIVAVIAISAIFLISSVYAQVPTTVNTYAWTDKTYYSLGEKGILKLVIRNDRTDQDLIMQNITINYPWFSYTGEKWEGNDTIIPSPPYVLSKNAANIYTTTVEFTLPSDGRVVSSPYTMQDINIKITVDKYPYQYTQTVRIYIKSTPAYQSFEDADKIVTLFTVQVVLVIVCTVIIAATIFLSARRPQIMWRKEEKAE